MALAGPAKQHGAQWNNLAHPTRRDALAARLKGARRLRAEQSSKAVQGAQRWRIEDTSFQQQDQEGDAVLASEQSAHSPLRQGRLGMPVRPTASPRESFRKPRKRNDGSDSLLSRVALPGLNEMQRTWWPVRSTPLPLRGAVAMSPYGATVSSARPPASPRPSIRRPSTGGRKKQGLHDGLFTRGDRPLNDDLFRHSSRASHKNEPSPAAVAQTYPPGYTPSQMPAKRRPVTAPLLQRRRAFVETHIMEHAEPGDAGVNVAVSHDSGSAGDDRDSTLSESDRHVKLSWAHGLVIVCQFSSASCVGFGVGSDYPIKQAGDFERARQSAQDAINADAHNATGYLRCFLLAVSIPICTRTTNIVVAAAHQFKVLVYRCMCLVPWCAFQSGGGVVHVCVRQSPVLRARATWLSIILGHVMQACRRTQRAQKLERVGSSHQAGARARRRRGAFP